MADHHLRETYVTGLRNAYALEGQAIEMMERQLERVESYPDVRRTLAQHLEETRVQRTRIEQILGSLNEDTSTLKDWAMSLMGNMSAIGHSMSSDEILKNTYANYAFEHFEIATYRSLICMAEAIGHEEAIPHLRQSLHEEENAARMVGQSIEPVTLQFARSEAMGQRASR